jgi:ankyrin repeat protein
MLSHLLKSKQPEVAKSYIKNKKFDIHDKDYENATPIICASEHGYCDIVELLIANGASIFDCADMQRQPLHKACSGGHLDIIKLLINHGADIFKKDELGFDALVTAVQFGRANVVDYLLSIGANPNYILKSYVYDGYSPLMMAVTTEHTNSRIVQKLINAGADMNYTSALGLSALHLVVDFGNIMFLLLLLQNGADPNLQNRFGVTPLFLAAVQNKSDIIEFLIQYGARVNDKNRFGLTPLNNVVIFQKSEANLKTVRQLLFAGADPNIQDSEGKTALHNALCPLVKETLEHWPATKAMIVMNNLQLDWFMDYGFWTDIQDFIK